MTRMCKRNVFIFGVCELFVVLGTAPRVSMAIRSPAFHLTSEDLQSNLSLSLKMLRAKYYSFTLYLFDIHHVINFIFLSVVKCVLKAKSVKLKAFVVRCFLFLFHRDHRGQSNGRINLIIARRPVRLACARK